MYIDIIFLILLIIACIKGYREGLIVSLFSIIGLIAGVAAALKLSTYVAERLAGNFNNLGKWLPFISFMIVFLIVVITVNILAKIIQKTIELIYLGWINRVGGVLLHTILYCIVFSIFLFYAVQLKFISEETVSSSKLYIYIQPLGPIVINSIGNIIPWFKGMFTQLQDFFEKTPLIQPAK